MKIDLPCPKVYQVLAKILTDCEDTKKKKATRLGSEPNRVANKSCWSIVYGMAVKFLVTTVVVRPSEKVELVGLKVYPFRTGATV